MRVVARLDPRQLLTDGFEGRPDTSHTRYGSQREHLLGWLTEYGGPGAYRRKNPGRDARFFYSHFRCAPGLLYLAEALGEERDALRKAITAVESAPANPSSQCAAFRRHVPWTRIEELIAERAAEGTSFRSLLRALRPQRSRRR